MWNWLVWLLSLFTPVAPASAPVDYVGPVAAEAAYASLRQSDEPAKPKVPRSECKTCEGTGRVRSGDGQGWTKCPDCEPDEGALPRLGLEQPKGPGFPPRAVPAAE
jgi:hypothetical protein